MSSSVQLTNLPSGWAEFSSPAFKLDDYYYEETFKILGKSQDATVRLLQVKDRVFTEVNGLSFYEGRVTFDRYIACKETNLDPEGNVGLLKEDENRGPYIYSTASKEKHFLYALDGKRRVVHLASGKKYLNDFSTWARFTGLLLCLFQIPLTLICGIKRSITNKNLFPLLEMVVRLIFSPFFMVVAVGIMIDPYEWKPFYADMEKIFHGKAFTANCFQPNANTHSLGGQIHRRNQL